MFKKEDLLSLFNNTKSFILIYILILGFFSLSFLQYEDFLNPGFEIFMFILLLAFGVISIGYYTVNKNNIHKVALVIILLFGITSVFLSPVNDISDEMEHTSRAYILSTGEISTTPISIPNFTTHEFKTINSIVDLSTEAGKNLFNTNLVNEKIDYGENHIAFAFSQNPFFAYIPQAIGMLIAECLDLNAIWLLWLGRLCNLLFYASIVTIAIRKSPVFKFPLTIVAIVPMAIYQAASMSADCLFNAFAILSIAYFFVLYKSGDRGVKWSDLAIFYVSIILCGLLKPPYLALSLLIFLVPSINFKNKKQNIVSKLAIIIALVIGLAWSNYGSSQLLYSWRGDDFARNHVNATEQMAFILSNPEVSIVHFFQTFTNLPVVAERLFYFSNSTRQYNSLLLAILYTMFFAIFSIIYPLEEKFKLSKRIKLLLTSILIYVGIFFVQYLTWAPVGSDKIIDGINGRYFIPLLIFLPLIFNLDIKNLNKQKASMVILTIAISFVAGMLMLTTAIKY